MADTISIPPNQAIQLAEVLAKLMPSFFGKTATESGTGSSSSALSETGTSAQKKAIDSQTQSQIDALLGTTMSNATGTGQSDAVVQEILRKAGIAFAPTLALRNQAGVHNDSVSAQLQAEAIAAAVGESSQAVLQAQQQAASTASGLLKTTAEGNAAIAGTTTGDKTATGATSENKTSTTNPTLFGKNPIEAILLAGITGYAGSKLKKFAEPYLDSVFGSDGGSVTNSFGSLRSADATGLEAAEAGTPVSTASTAGAAPGFSYTNASGAGAEDTASITSTSTIVPETEAGATDAVNAVTGQNVPAISPPITPEGSYLSTDVNDLYQGGNVVVADSGAAGTTTDVTSGLFDSATANADSAFAIPEAASGAAEGAGALGAAGVGSIFAFPLTFAIGDMLDTGSQDRASSISAYEQAHGAGSYAKFAADRDAGTGDFAPGGQYYDMWKAINAPVENSTNAGG